MEGRAQEHKRKVSFFKFRSNRLIPVISSRGAFGYLPTYFRNDLVHGSWFVAVAEFALRIILLCRWFVFGSIFVTICALLVVVNKQQGYQFLGVDDSDLSPAKYEDSWILLSVSGFFFTVGSFAFVRAMSDPPMKPMFKWYHFQTDELFGSWMFALGTFPGIPWRLVLY
jgi:hypothetical protein